MVDVSEKSITSRKAMAIGNIHFSNPIALSQIRENSNKKGDVLSIARIAGILAVKQTSNLIPLCHNIFILKINVDFQEIQNGIKASCVVKCDGKTGVEMEALTGVTTTLLTVYDMCKAVDKKMLITGIQVVEKQGGKSGDYKVDDLT